MKKQMTEIYQIDDLNRGILNAPMDNVCTPMLNWLRTLPLAPAQFMCHVRVEKIKQAGIITGTRVDVNPKRLDYDVCCFSTLY